MLGSGFLRADVITVFIVWRSVASFGRAAASFPLVGGAEDGSDAVPVSADDARNGG
jgi:hypothetical protein